MMTKTKKKKSYLVKFRKVKIQNSKESESEIKTQEYLFWRFFFFNSVCYLQNKILENLVFQNFSSFKNQIFSKNWNII